MSCGPIQQLEAVASGEASPSQLAEAQAHLQACSRCRQELQWLRTERAMFRARASRDEVGHLWKGVARRRGFQPARPWGRVLVGVAAAALAAVGVGLLSGAQPAARPPGAGLQISAATSEPGVSEPVMSLQLEPAACSRLPAGLGFHCAAEVPASFVASR